VKKFKQLLQLEESDDRQTQELSGAMLDRPCTIRHVRPVAIAVAIIFVCSVQSVCGQDATTATHLTDPTDYSTSSNMTVDSNAGTINKVPVNSEEFRVGPTLQAAAREKDLEERIAFRADIKAKRAAEIKAEEERLRGVQVVYGAVIVLKHTRSERLLSGSSFRYIHRDGSGQHQVHTAEVEDGYTHWRVMPRSGQRWELVKDVPVKNGEVIRLSNMRSHLNLHSHKGPKSPVSFNNEVSTFGQEYGSIDPNDNWVLKTNGAETWHMGTEVDLVHAPFRAQLLSHDKGANSTFGHPEVFCQVLNPKPQTPNNPKP
jgi:hypothetical protein